MGEPAQKPPPLDDHFSSLKTGLVPSPGHEAFSGRRVPIVTPVAFEKLPIALHYISHGKRRSKPLLAPPPGNDKRLIPLGLLQAGGDPALLVVEPHA